MQISVTVAVLCFFLLFRATPCLRVVNRVEHNRKSHLFPERISFTLNTIIIQSSTNCSREFFRYMKVDARALIKPVPTAR